MTPAPPVTDTLFPYASSKRSASSTLRFTPRHRQQQAINAATAVLVGRSRMALVAPTGSGKSLIEAALLLEGYAVSCPSMDICDGIAQAACLPVALSASTAKRRKVYEENGLWTYKRLHSYLAKGGTPPPGIVFDEGHHATANTLDQIIGMCPGAGVVLVTATMYRGTPDGTAKLLALVGNQVFHVISLRDAVNERWITLPSFSVLPLMDDETISVTGGEFEVTASEAMARDSMADLVARIVANEWDAEAGLWRDPTTLVLPGVANVAEFAEALGHDRVAVVTAETGNRRALFDETLARRRLLLQVRAVGEGTDLALRCMYDAAPTTSPTLWMQRVGRTCRPGGVSRYITTCHNLLRHGYLFEGLVPPAAFRDAIAAWGEGFKPSRRTVARAMGLTGFGRFSPSEVKLANGGTAFLYALTDKGGTTELAAVLIPHEAQPRYYVRTIRHTGEFGTFEPRPGVTVEYEKKERGRWAKVPTLPEMIGCTSLPDDPITPGRLKWWREQAQGRGLDAVWTPTCKSFNILPILTNTGDRL